MHARHTCICAHTHMHTPCTEAHTNMHTHSWKDYRLGHLCFFFFKKVVKLLKKQPFSFWRVWNAEEERIVQSPALHCYPSPLPPSFPNLVPCLFWDVT